MCVPTERTGQQIWREACSTNSSQTCFRTPVRWAKILEMYGVGADTYRASGLFSFMVRIMITLTSYGHYSTGNSQETTVSGETHLSNEQFKPWPVHFHRLASPSIN